MKCSSTFADAIATGTVLVLEINVPPEASESANIQRSAEATIEKD